MDSITSLDADRRTPLSRERIVRAAIVLMDDEGASALSMRRLGQQLSVRAMAMYKHFENRDDLVTAVLESLYAELALGGIDGDPFDALKAEMLAINALIERHPFVRELFSSKSRTPQVWETRRLQHVAALVAAGAPHIDAKLGYSILFRMMLGTLSPNPHEAKDRENELVLFGLEAVIDLLRKRAGA